ncbi:hypothetical protein EYF80_025184 [Liparis tanakae]|uniref:Uncharacterized protein n=1 Tax=Liparis tanakae TaxID=230148 RepID=A0A4Z2HFB0_9TELE|nr:hypothetical protein EYF80_025184 [Liparis tanakae]
MLAFHSAIKMLEAPLSAPEGLGRRQPAPPWKESHRRVESKAGKGLRGPRRQELIKRTRAAFQDVGDAIRTRRLLSACSKSEPHGGSFITPGGWLSSNHYPKTVAAVNFLSEKQTAASEAHRVRVAADGLMLRSGTANV